MWLHFLPLHVSPCTAAAFVFICRRLVQTCPVEIDMEIVTGSNLVIAVVTFT